MRRIIFGMLAFMLLLSACASPSSPTPAPSPTPDIAAITSAISGTMVASALTAQPTATQPPTGTPLPTGTATSLPPSETPTPTETATPIPFVGTLAPSGIEGVSIGYFLIQNNTSETLSVSINGFTEPGNKPVYISYDVKGAFLFTIPYGTYQYTVFVGTKKSFTGGFRINNKDKTTMRVSMTKVVVVGP